MERLVRSLTELRMALPMPLNALGVVLRETVRRNRVRDGLVYLQVTRGVARRDFLFPAAGTPPSIVVTARSLDPVRLERIAAEGIAVRHGAGQSLGAGRHQVGVAPAQRAGQGDGARCRRQGSLVRRPGRLRHRRRLEQCLDRHARRHARHPLGRPRHPARHHPHRDARSRRARRSSSSRSANSRSRRPTRRAKRSSPRRASSSCRSCRSTAGRWATALPDWWRRRCGAISTGLPR